MNILEQLQEKYIQEFTQNVPLDEFLLNLLITAILAVLLQWFYIRFGNSISNRKRFAANFLPLALGTLLVIMIVKSSIALSLGLVGALSIVRYRAAIKDPEELTFLFIAVGIGLAGGANQPVLAALAFALIIGLLYVNLFISGKKAFRSDNKMVIHIQTDSQDVKQLTELLSTHLTYVELRRLDAHAHGMELSFLCKAESIDQLSAFKDALRQWSATSRLSIVEQPDLLV